LKLLEAPLSYARIEVGPKAGAGGVPLTATGKIDKKLLRKRYASLLSQ